MDAVRVVSHCERPFDVAKIIYVHCIDLGTEKFTSVVSFPCLEVCYVLGHFSFPSDLAVRRLCCVLWSDDSKGKLANIRSPVLLNVKSSCYFTVNIFFCLFVVHLWKKNQHRYCRSCSFAGRLCLG